MGLGLVYPCFDMWKILADDTAVTRMWSSSLPWWEFIARGAIVYLFVLVLLRVTGKRQVGQLAPFDLVLLLVLSNSIQNAMNGGDNTITGGVISACTLVGINYCVGMVTFKSKLLEGIIEGHPVLLVHNGQINHKAMKAVRMTVHELTAAIRACGCAGPHDVRVAVLENSGDVTVIQKNGHEGNHAHNHGSPTLSHKPGVSPPYTGGPEHEIKPPPDAGSGTHPPMEKP